MLILVAVSVLLVINSGLIGKTREAAETTTNEYRKEAHYGEQAQITIGGVTYNSIAEYEAVLNGGANPGGGEPEEPIVIENEKFTITETATESRASILTVALNPVAEATFTCDGETIENVEEAQFILKNPGTYIINATVNEETEDASPTLEDATANEETVNASHTTTQCKTETFSSICTEPTELKAGANGIVTPVTDPGDTIVAVVPAGFAYGTSENVGKVSTGLVITDNVDANHYSTGNEFVWIPVDSDLNVGTGSKKMAKLQSGSSTDYEGVLYDFSGSGNNTTSTANSNYTALGSSYGEPRILMNTSYINTTKEPNLNLQTKYNNMVEKVKLTGGFYVGRYELGAGNSNNISKLGIVPAAAGDYPTSTWYGLQNRAESYTHPNSTYTGTVTSQMMWGSQYDAMLNFALEGNDKAKVNLLELGNHTDEKVKTGTAIPTAVGSDKIINIYDLAGNEHEWTAEAHGDSYRVLRGGRYITDETDTASSRTIRMPYIGGDTDSARASLYVNGYNP